MEILKYDFYFILFFNTILYTQIIDLNNLESPVIKKFDDFNDQVSDMLFLSYKKTLICARYLILIVAI